MSTSLPTTAPAGAAPAAALPKIKKSVSIFQRRWRKFRQLKRGWYSFLLLSCVYIITLFNPLLVNDKALVVSYKGQLYFPAIADWLFSKNYEVEALGQTDEQVIGEVQYRKLKAEYAAAGVGNWVLMAPYPYGPIENLLSEPHLTGFPPHPPSTRHWMGTDDRGRDVFSRLVYGFRISITFALGVLVLAYAFGILIGAILGFFGGRVDFYVQRLVEIWSTLPFLYTIIIVSSIVRPNLPIFILLLAIFSWVGISYYMRGEFYREKAKDYVAAAIAQGESNLSIMFRHILPNSLTPVISFAPFAMVGYISSLVALDFLGFGLRPPTPSWGELVRQGLDHLTSWHLVVFPLGALFVTLMMVVFIGEAVREAFDPKVFARLR